MNDKILEILQGTRPESDFLNSKNFICDSLLDSFDMVVLIAEIEDQFKVVIDGTDVIPENFYSIETIAHLIESSR